MVHDRRSPEMQNVMIQIPGHSCSNSHPATDSSAYSCLSNAVRVAARVSRVRCTTRGPHTSFVHDRPCLLPAGDGPRANSGAVLRNEWFLWQYPGRLRHRRGRRWKSGAGLPLAIVSSLCCFSSTKSSMVPSLMHEVEHRAPSLNVTVFFHLLLLVKCFRVTVAGCYRGSH